MIIITKIIDSKCNNNNFSNSDNKSLSNDDSNKSNN